MIKLKSLIVVKESMNKTVLEKETDKFRKSLIQKYPELDYLDFNINFDQTVLDLNNIRIKEEFRNKGIGTKIIQEIKSFADRHKLIIRLSPEPDFRKKKKLDRFYKRNDFVVNKGRNRDYRISSFFGKTMYRRPKLTESFELPPDMDLQSEKLAKFIASFFLESFKTKIDNEKSDEQIVKYNEYYRLAKQYREEGKPLFKTMEDNTKTHWGKSSLKIYPKIDMEEPILPDVILKISDGYPDSTFGYYDIKDDVDEEPPQEIFILIDTQHFMDSFQKSTEELTDTLKHEIRHWLQFTKQIGLPKTKISSKHSDILGTHFKFSKVRDPHYMRDAEFKTNVHSYAFYIKKFLNNNFSKKDWKKQFNKMVTGNTTYTDSNLLFIIVNNIENMMKKDRPRWSQFVKELYKIIFEND